MINLATLSKRAKASEDGEAFLPVTRRPGCRLGVGARFAAGTGPDYFVEVVLDPFPERPNVSPRQLEDAGVILERLRGRGYAQACDDAGVLTCERTVDRSAVTTELREVRNALSPVPGKTRSRRRA